MKHSLIKEHSKSTLEGTLNLDNLRLESFMDALNQKIDEEIRDKKLYASRNITKHHLKKLKELKEKILGASEESFGQLREEILRNTPVKHKDFADKYLKDFKKIVDNDPKNLVNIINSNINKLEEKDLIISYMWHSFSKHIQLYIEPNISKERFYLKQGILIVPTEDAYHVFKLRTIYCQDCEREEIRFEQLTEKGLNSINKAKNLYIAPQSLITIAIAKNTEHYPLVDTALPILKEKYEKRLGLIE